MRIVNTRKLGLHGPTVSAVGLGCMGMSDFYGSKATRDDVESLATIHAALDAGITLLDTADYYGAGHNELLIREAIKGRKERSMICVKFGGLRTPDGGFTGVDIRPEAVKNFAAYSLTRLGMDTIDIYQPGRIPPGVPIEDTVAAVSDLIQAGYVRYLALSEASPEQLRRAHKIHPVCAVQVEYSLATRIIEKELLAVARELGVGILAYGVLSRGLLSGALGASFEPTDFRAHAPRFTTENLAENRKRVETLERFAERKACTPTQIAIAWVLHRGHDIVPLVGTSNRRRLQENLGALKIRLSPPEVQELSDAFPEGSFRGERYPSQQMGMVVH